MIPPFSSSVTSILTTLSRKFDRVTIFHRYISTTTPLMMAKSYKIAKISDLKDGQMKEITLPGTEDKILLSRIQGNFYATGNRCTRTLYSI